jgi:hypothetical protein
MGMIRKREIATRRISILSSECFKRKAELTKNRETGSRSLKRIGVYYSRTCL